MNSNSIPPASLPVGNWFAAMPVSLPEGLLPELRRQAPGGLRWFVPEDVHLTIAFFGRYEPARLASVAALARTLPRFHIMAHLGPLKPLPSPRRFSALSFELAGGAAEAVGVMRECHLPLMTAAGQPPDQRSPYPHITVARPHRRASQAERRAILQWCESLPASACEVKLGPIQIYGWATNRTERQFQCLNAA